MRSYETFYNGILFRSRLESRWAAFFDRIGWQWEYEPWDADDYIPDFLIHGDRPLLVEVKPDATVADLQQYEPRVSTALAAHWDSDILIVGCSPKLSGRSHWSQWDFTAGRLSGPYDSSFDVGLWTRCGKCDRFAVFQDTDSYQCRPCGHHDGDHYLTNEPIELVWAWSDASNAVRWTPAGRP